MTLVIHWHHPFFLLFFFPRVLHAASVPAPVFDQPLPTNTITLIIFILTLFWLKVKTIQRGKSSNSGGSCVFSLVAHRQFSAGTHQTVSDMDKQESVSNTVSILFAGKRQEKGQRTDQWNGPQLRMIHTYAVLAVLFDLHVSVHLGWRRQIIS